MKWHGCAMEILYLCVCNYSIEITYNLCRINPFVSKWHTGTNWCAKLAHKNTIDMHVTHYSHVKWTHSCWIYTEVQGAVLIWHINSKMTHMWHKTQMLKQHNTFYSGIRVFGCVNNSIWCWSTRWSIFAERVTFVYWILCIMGL